MAHERDPNFLQYFVRQTEKSFKELKNDVSQINSRLDDLLLLKAQLSSDARWRTWLISGMTGAFTFIVTLGVTIWLAQRSSHAQTESTSALIDREISKHKVPSLTIIKK